MLCASLLSMSDMTGVTRSRLSRSVPAVAFGLTAAVHLATQLWQPSSVIADVTQVMLMPLLGWNLVSWNRPAAHRTSRLTAWVVAALFFSWLGDTLPRFLTGDTAFLTLVGCFLIAQLIFIGAFWPYRRSSVVTRPLRLLPYLALFTVLVLLCAPKAGGLLVPVILYGIALMTMAVLSTGLGAIAGAGGALFFVSDGLIAVRELAGISVPAHDFAVMSTYIFAQALIVIAVVTTAASPMGPASRRWRHHR